MGDNQQEDDELIMVDPTQDMINLWTSLIDHTSANSLKVHAENQLEVNLFKNGGIVNKGPNKRDARRRIKTSLENSGFNPEQVRLAIENYAQNGEFMNLAIDKVDSKSTFMFDLDSEGWSTAIELERVGLLKKIEDVDFDRSVFQQAKEICMMNEYQKEFYPGHEAPLSGKKTTGSVEARADITHQVEKENEREKQAELRERSRNLNKEKEREKDKERERERINMENKKDKDNKENREINKDKERPSRKPLALDSSRSNSPEKIRKNRHLEDGEIYQNHRDNSDLFNEQEKEDKLHPQVPYSKTHYKSKHRDDYVVTFSFISGQANSSKKPAVTSNSISTSAASLRERRPLSPKRVTNPSRKDICFEAKDIRPINRSKREICFVADDIRAVKQKPISKAPIVIEIDDHEELTPPKPKKKTDSSVVFVIDSDNDDEEDEEVIFGPLLSPDINPGREGLFSEDSDMELLSEGKISEKLKSHRDPRLQVPFEKLNTIAGLSSTFHIPPRESVNRPLQYNSDQPQFKSSQQPLQHSQGPYSTQTPPHLQPNPHPHIHPHPHPHLHPQPHPNLQHQRYSPMPLGSFSPPRQNPSFYPSTRGPLPEPGIGGPYPRHGHSLPVKRHLSFTPPSHQNNHLIEKLGPECRSFQEYRGSLKNNFLPCPDQVIQPEDFEESPYFPLSMTTAEQIMRRKKEYKTGYDSPEPEPGEIMHERNVSPVRL